MKMELSFILHKKNYKIAQKIPYYKIVLVK